MSDKKSDINWTSLYGKAVKAEQLADYRSRVLAQIRGNQSVETLN